MVENGHKAADANVSSYAENCHAEVGVPKGGGGGAFTPEGGIIFRSETPGAGGGRLLRGAISSVTAQLLVS